MKGADRLKQQTILDFGEQWARYRDNEAYYASAGLLADIMEPLLPIADIKGKRVADIGSGTGRIVNMLLDAGAGHRWSPPRRSRFCAKEFVIREPSRC